MAKPHAYRTEAIVLNRTNLGEADCIVTLYTPNLGKIRAVAKGVRRPRSKLGGHLDLLLRSALLLAHGQNLDIITQSQTIESFLPLRNDLKRVACALYLAELVDRFTPEQAENYAVYELLQNDLVWLCVARDHQVVLRHFELHLLRHLGYEPELYCCLRCKSPVAPEQNLFSASTGGVLCPACGAQEPMARSISVDALKIMRFLLSSEPAPARRLRMGRQLSQELEQLNRWYVAYLLEREVKSLGFLDHLERESQFPGA